MQFSEGRALVGADDLLDEAEDHRAVVTVAVAANSPEACEGVCACSQWGL